MRKKTKSLIQKGITIFLAIIMVMTMYNFSENNHLYAQNVNVNGTFVETLSEDKQSAKVQLTITPKEDQVIERITLPDGTIKDREAMTKGDSGQLIVDYLATKNDTYSFIIDYVEMNLIEEVKAENKTVEEKTTSTPTYTQVKKQEALTYIVKNIVKVENIKNQEATIEETITTFDARNTSGLVSLTSNKENGWKWWIDDINDISAGVHHLQYTIKVMPDVGGPSERTMTLSLGNEDGGTFQITEIANDPVVIRSSVIADDKRSVELVLDNTKIAADGWTLGIIVMPEGKDVRTAYTNGSATYGSYIGQKFYDNQTFGTSATITEAGDSTTTTIDFSLDELYTATGGADSHSWLNATGAYTTKADSPRSLGDLEALMDGKLGYNGQVDGGALVVETTSQMHMPAGDLQQHIYTPQVYGIELEMSQINKTSATGIVGSSTTAICAISGDPAHVNMPADKQRPLASGTYVADKNAVVEWYQLEYNPTTKTLSKVKKVIDFGKMTVKVPEYTVKNTVQFNENATTVDETTTMVYLHYNTPGGLEACDYGNGTLTFTIPEYFQLKGLAEPSLFTQVTITYEDGSSRTVNTADMEVGKDDTNLSVLSNKKITKIECKLTEAGIRGPFDKTSNMHPMDNLRQYLYGSFTDPDPLTDARDDPMKNMITINGVFASEDGAITASGNIRALFYDLGQPIDKPYLAVGDGKLLFDSGEQSYNDANEGFRNVVMGVDQLTDLGDDNLTTSSPRYKNLDITLSPTNVLSNEAGDNQWKTIQSYMFNQIFGNITGSQTFTYYADAWIEYTLTGESQPRKIYINKDGQLQNTWLNFRVVFPGYDAANNVFLTSLKIHFEDVLIPARTEPQRLKEILALGYSMDRRWVTENPTYAGKEFISASWTSTITYDGQTEDHIKVTPYKYEVYAKSSIHKPVASQQDVGVAVPNTAVKGAFIPTDIKVVMPFSVNVDASQNFNLNDKQYATPLPIGSKLYLKLNTSYYNYYGSTLASNPNSLIDLIKDKNGDSWLAYDLTGITPSVQGGSNDFSVSIPANTIRTNAAAQSGMQYDIFTEVYVDAQPLEQLSREDNAGHIDYYYDTDINAIRVTDNWNIANGSTGLIPVKLNTSTQITATAQEQLYILAGLNNNVSIDGINWKANEANQLQATVQIGSPTKEYHNYELFIPLPQMNGTTKNDLANITKDNTYTIHVDDVKLQSGVAGTITYYDTEDGTGAGTAIPSINTKSVRILLDQFTGNMDVGLELYIDADITYELADMSASFITAKSIFNYYPIDEATGIIDKTILLAGAAESGNFGIYTFNWYTMSGKIFIDNINKIPDGLYNTGDTLYNQSSFTFKDLTNDQEYTATVNQQTGIYNLRIKPRKIAYTIAPVIENPNNYVLTVDTSSNIDDENNTNFPRNYETQGAEFIADKNGMRAISSVNDFTKANVGLYKQTTVTTDVYPLHVKVGETLETIFTPSIGGHFEKIEALDANIYGTFTYIKQPNIDGTQTIGKVKLLGITETLDTDGKTSIYKPYKVTLSNYFGEEMTIEGTYQVYKDPFVTFMRDTTIDGKTYTGTWTSSDNLLSKEILTQTSPTNPDKQNLVNSSVPTLSLLGYTMTGWTLTRDGNIILEKITDFTGIDVEKYDVFYPTWEANPYTIKYDKNNLNASGSMASSTHVYDTTKALSANSYDYPGYTFIGWSTTPTGTVVYTDKQSVLNLTDVKDEELTLYAIWKVNTYTIKYDKNATDAIGTMTDSNHVYDTTKILNTNSYSRQGYQFKGWSTTSSGIVTYTDKQSVLNLTTQRDGEVTLYAVWEANNHTIKYDKNNLDATGIMADSTHIYDIAKTLSPNSYILPGYTFKGWSKTSTGTVDYTDQQSILNLTDVKNEEITLYAIWEANAYTIIFNGNGADGNEGMNNQDFIYNEAQPLSKNTLTKVGHTFIGWTTQADGSGDKYQDEQQVMNLTIQASGTVTLYAQWLIVWYNVDFKYVSTTNPEGIAIPAQITVEYGTVIVEPKVTIPANWKLDGWYSDKECTQKYDFTQMMTSDMTLYSKWSYQEPEVPVVPEEPVIPPKPQTPTQPDIVITPNEPTTPNEVVSPEVEEKEPEKEPAVAVSRDIPLSKTKNGITEDLLRQYITATTKNGAIGFEIISHTVQSKVGQYEATIRLTDGTELTVKIKVVDDTQTEVEQPGYGRDQECIIHWIILLMLAGYSIYAAIAIFKRRKDNKELENALEEATKRGANTNEN